VGWDKAYVTQYFKKQQGKKKKKRVYYFYATIGRRDAFEFGQREAATTEARFVPIAELTAADFPKRLDIFHGIMFPQANSREVTIGDITAISPVRIPYNEPQMYGDYLEENGYVVIKNVFSEEEVETAKGLFWEWIQGLGSGIDPENSATWTNQNWPDRHPTGVIYTHGIGQSDFMWYCRTRPQVIRIFQRLWNRKDLLTSYDGCGAFRPWHVDETYKTSKSWLHVDQNPLANPGREAVQGLISMYDATPETGGFICLPRSQKYFKQYADIFRGKIASELGLVRLTNKAFDGHPVRDMKKHMIQCKAGDMILWDSRTVHANTHALLPPTADRNELIRLTSYICMTPRQPDHTDEFIQMRCAAIQNHTSTNHKPFEFSPNPDVAKNNNSRCRKNNKPLQMSERRREVTDLMYSLATGTEPIETVNTPPNPADFDKDGAEENAV